jgi:hypothetical protein
MLYSYKKKGDKKTLIVKFSGDDVNRLKQMYILKFINKSLDLGFGLFSIGYFKQIYGEKTKGRLRSKINKNGDVILGCEIILGTTDFEMFENKRLIKWNINSHRLKIDSIVFFY